VIPLPTWVDPEAWAEFVDMRRRIKKPLTQRAAERQLFRLFKLKEAGHDPNASLVQSADCYWLALYPPKDMKIEPRENPITPKPGAPSQWRQDFEQHKARSQTPEAHAARRAVMEKLGR
jgi:hypothetical protein